MQDQGHPTCLEKWAKLRPRRTTCANTKDNLSPSSDFSGPQFIRKPHRRPVFIRSS